MEEGQLTTVTIEMPRVAACSKDRFGGILTWTAALARRYSPNEPSSGRVKWLEWQVGQIQSDVY